MSKAALHDPALSAEAGAVGCSTTSNDWCDPESPQEPAVLVEVIATISQDTVGLLAWPPALASHRTSVEVFDQRQQLGDVVTVAAGQGNCQRYSARVNQQVVL